jgi:hypothetical protein
MIFILFNFHQKIIRIDSRVLSAVPAIYQYFIPFLNFFCRKMPGSESPVPNRFILSEQVQVYGMVMKGFTFAVYGDHQVAAPCPFLQESQGGNDTEPFRRHPVDPVTKRCAEFMAGSHFVRIFAGKNLRTVNP